MNLSGEKLELNEDSQAFTQVKNERSQHNSCSTHVRVCFKYPSSSDNSIPSYCSIPQLRTCCNSSLPLFLPSPALQSHRGQQLKLAKLGEWKKEWKSQPHTPSLTEGSLTSSNLEQISSNFKPILEFWLLNELSALSKSVLICILSVCYLYFLNLYCLHTICSL